MSRPALVSKHQVAETFCGQRSEEQHVHHDQHHALPCLNSYSERIISKAIPVPTNVAGMMM